MRAHVLNQTGDIINTILVDEIGAGQIDADITGGGIGQRWNGIVVIDKPRDVATEKAVFILAVKSEAGALTQQVLQGLGSEYELAEKQAEAYKAASYTGTAPSSIQSEINSKAAKGITITAHTACEAILAMAAGWREAQASLRDMRLTTSSAAEVVVDGDALDTIKAAWSAFLVALKTQLGV
jgi:hypothetical protein